MQKGGEASLRSWPIDSQVPRGRGCTLSLLHIRFRRQGGWVVWKPARQCELESLGFREGATRSMESVGDVMADAFRVDVL